MPLISVVMPTYKVEEYFPQCIESVLNQTLKDIEIIPVDDGSPDSCGKIMDSYAARDSRVKPIHQKNGGYGKAVNSGIEKALGTYVAIVETDDYIEPDMLEVLYKAAEKYQADVVKAGFRKLYSDGSSCDVKPPFPFYNPEVIVNPCYCNDLMLMESSIWAALYRRDYLEKNQIKMIETSGAAYQDGIFKFMVYSCTEKVVCIQNPVYNYRVMTANSSSKSSKNWDAEFKNYAHIKKWLVEHQKFDDFKDAFYLHAYFDFLFHYNRLDDQTQKKFLVKAKEFYQEGKNVGVGLDNARFERWETRNYYYNDVYPFLKQFEEKKRTIRFTGDFLQRRHDLAKKTFRFIYHTVLGKVIWRKFNQFMHRPFIWNKLHEGETADINTNQLQCIDFDTGIFELEPVDKQKRALVILPWYSENATVQNVERISGMIKARGYQLHLFLYYDGFRPHKVNRKIWDRVFFQHTSNPYFSHTNDSLERADGDHIDDWLDDDFLQSIVRMDEHYHYDLCLANYLIYSKAFEVLPNTRKILYTHDKFTKRNSALRAAGFPEWSFWFGVDSAQEEARALKRADIVLAVQEEDASFFRRITNNKIEVITYPFIPPYNYVEERKITNSSNENMLSVGYLASSNPPNYFAIKKLMKTISKNKRVQLFVAGSICDRFSSLEVPENVTILGYISDLREFYSAYDVYVNPDTFYSGLKCKTLEALSYGVPIVCTKVAATGLNLEKNYHQLENEIECGKYLMRILDKAEKREELMKEMMIESRSKFELFNEKYSIDDLTNKLVEN